MLNLPYEKIIEIIKNKSGLSEQDIKQKVEEKVKQLSELVSKEGAAHIVANQLGIQLMDVSKKLKIGELKEGVRNVEVTGKVTRVFEMREFTKAERQGKVGSLFIGDETGTIRVTLWGDMAENVKKIKEGDVVKIKEAYTRLNNNFTEIHLNDKSIFIINPEGEKIDEVKINTHERKYLSEAQERERVEVVGTIVQVFDPRYFELCPDCMKRARQKEDGFFCEIHGKVENPKMSYVLNAVLDDGTDNIRVVLYKERAEELLSKLEEEILAAKDDPQKTEALKSEIFGKTVKVQGTIRTNSFFDRQELIANKVFRDIDIQEETKRVEEALAVKG